jgi:hypothetical protein
MLLFLAASRCHHQSGHLSFCITSISSTIHLRSDLFSAPFFLKEPFSAPLLAHATHRGLVLIIQETLCLAGEDAVLVEGEVPSQEMTGRPVVSLSRLSW